MTQTPHIRPDPIIREIKALLPGFEDVLHGGPTAAELGDAPKLDEWSFVARGSFPALAGISHGHPILPDDAIVTSQTIWYDLAGGWARTRSRWYTLGSAAPTIPEVMFRGLILEVISPAEAYEAMTRAPAIFYHAVRELREADLTERLELICQAWPPKTAGGKLH